MKKIAILILMIWSVTAMSQEKLEIVGKVKITEMDPSNSDSVVVWNSDGTLSMREAKDLVSGLLLQFGIGIGPTGISGLLNAGFTVSEILDAGATPLELWKGGVKVDSIYGRSYAGGLIFYLDTLNIHLNFEGMVAAPYGWYDGGVDPQLEWGCVGTDLPGLENVTSGPAGPGAEIGDGSTNTTAILSAGNCPAAAAALACRTYMGGAHDDWFLPSAKELDAMYLNLTTKGLGGFSNSYYWSSTEMDNESVWYQDFPDGNQSNDRWLECMCVVIQNKNLEILFQKYIAL